MSTIRMSTLIETLDVLSAVERQFQPDLKNALWHPVMVARMKLQSELTLLGAIEVRVDTPIPQPVHKETPT